MSEDQAHAVPSNPSINEEYNNFLSCLAEKPDDYTTMLVFADWIADHLDQAGPDHRQVNKPFEFCLRWCGARKKHPHHRLFYQPTKRHPQGRPIPDIYSWAWYSSGSYWGGDSRTLKTLPENSFLTRHLFMATVGVFEDHKFFSTCSEALLQLASGLYTLRREVSRDTNLLDDC